MPLLCTGVFPFLKSTVQIDLSLHKIAPIIVQMIMNEAINAEFTNHSPPPSPQRTVLVCFLSFPFSSTLASKRRQGVSVVRQLAQLT